jgi:hypothetical protein
MTFLWGMHVLIAVAREFERAMEEAVDAALEPLAEAYARHEWARVERELERRERRWSAGRG